MAEVLHDFNTWSDALSQPVGSPSPATPTYDVSADTVTPGSQPAAVEMATGQTQQAAQPTQQAPQAASQQSEKPPEGNLEQFNVSAQPLDVRGLFSGIGAQVQQGQQQLGQATQSFYEQAGPSRTFEGLGGTGAVESAIAGGTGDDMIRDWLSAQYGGPTGLSDESQADLRNLLGGLQARAPSFYGTRGVMDLLQQQSPTLTTGEARWEAERRKGDEGFKAAAYGAEKDVRDLASLLRSRTEETREFAKQREKEESGIREGTAGYLGQEEQKIADKLQGNLEQTKATRQQVQDLYQQFQDTGDISHLIEAEKLADPERAAAVEAYNKQLQNILGSEKYASIAGLPEMTYDETAKGSPYRWDENWYAQNTPTAEQKNLARERQKEIAALGDRPYSVSQFDTPLRQRTAEAKQIYQDIQEKYPETADYELVWGITDSGQPTYEVRHLPSGGKQIWHEFAMQNPQLGQQLSKRQAELEDKFGSQFGSYGADLPGVGRAAGGRGEYADVLPLYGTSKSGLDKLLDIPDLQQFVNLDQGVAPTLSNLATEEERERFNRINALQGDQARLDKPLTEYKDQDVQADVGGFLDKAWQEYSKQNKDVQDVESFYGMTQQQARKKYLENKGFMGFLNKNFGWAMPIVGALLPPVGLGLTALSGGALGLAGKETFGI